MAMVVVDGEKAKLGLVAFVKDWESHQSTHPPKYIHDRATVTEAFGPHLYSRCFGLPPNHPHFTLLRLSSHRYQRSRRFEIGCSTSGWMLFSGSKKHRHLVTDQLSWIL